MSSRVSHELQKLRSQYPGEFSIIQDGREVEITRFSQGEIVMRVKFSLPEEYPFQPPLIDLLYLDFPIPEQVCRRGTSLCDCEFRETWSPQKTMGSVLSRLYQWLQDVKNSPVKLDFGSPIPQAESGTSTDNFSAIH